MTNLEKACELLGWQGGTIHQVSQATGWTVDELLTMKDMDALLLSKATTPAATPKPCEYFSPGETCVWDKNRNCDHAVCYPLARITPEILKAKDMKKFVEESLALLYKYKNPDTCALAVSEMNDSELHDLTAYEYWKDGMEWSDVVEFRNGKIDRVRNLAVLRMHFGYVIHSI